MMIFEIHNMLQDVKMMINNLRVEIRGEGMCVCDILYTSKLIQTQHSKDQLNFLFTFDPTASFAPQELVTEGWCR